MNIILEGLAPFADPMVYLYLLLGVVIGMLVGAFPGVTGSMAVALATSFTLTLEPVHGLAVLLTIYVAANFGDRVPAILINTPGTPASIATTFDGFPMAKQGRAGLALNVSAIVSAIGTLVSLLLLMFLAIPLARFALRFGPAEMFMLVMFGMLMMIGVSGKSVIKGLLAGLLGLAAGIIGRDPITGDARLVFGINELNSGLPFIAIIIGLFGIAEIFDQMLTYRRSKQTFITDFGRWWPTKAEVRSLVRPVAVGSAVGGVVGVVPAAGGDIAGLIAWDRARAISKNPGKFGKGSLEGVAAADTASNATLGGSLTTTLALGVPGDAVMAVMIGSMIIWGITPGPSLFANQPDLVVTLTGIMFLATLLALAVSLLRVQGVAKILKLPAPYLWSTILVFCIVGTYSVSNSVFFVIVMLLSGIVGVGLKRAGFPAGPIVLGVLLGPLAEANLRRAMLIGGPESLVGSPIAATLFALCALVLCAPLLRRGLARVRGRAGSAEKTHVS